MFDCQVVSWFAVLPDCESATAAARALRAHGEDELPHASGRPWLIGRFQPRAVTIGGAGSTKIAVIGQHAVTRRELDDAAARTRTVADVDRLAGSLAGSFHLVASVGGSVRVQGSVTGIRRVFHAKVAGAEVAADRADLLASILGAAVDDRRLALHMLQPLALYPLAGQAVWHGVGLLPTDHYLVLERDEPGRTVRWWAPPEPDLPMSEGAPALREALCAAVDARVRDLDFATADLGGLDSTSICCVAARDGKQVVAYTAECWDPEADDARWAARTVAALPNVEHQLVPLAEMPLSWEGILEIEDRFDEPFAGVVDRGRMIAAIRRAAVRGSRLHLVGFGGDELLYGSAAHMHSLLRTNPVVAWRHLRGFAVKYRWPRRRMLRQLADRSSYRSWLARVADNLQAPVAGGHEPLLDWGFEPRLPPWATPATFDAVRELIRAEAAIAEPLARGRGQHRELETMRFVCRAARHDEQMAARMGIRLAAPYYDDRVIEAGLAVRPEERVTPWRYKPLIIEAMRGIVPEVTLARQTKANATYEEEVGLREHRAEVRELFEGSRLAQRGLIDGDALLELLTRPLPPHVHFFALHQTVACEVWLRSLERTSSPGNREEAFVEAV